MWIRHMKVYAMVSAVGFIGLLFLFPQFSAHVHEQTRLMMLALFAAGLLFLAGLFGLAVSCFFHLWHQEKKDS